MRLCLILVSSRSIAHIDEGFTSFRGAMTILIRVDGNDTNDGEITINKYARKYDSLGQVNLSLLLIRIVT